MKRIASIVLALALILVTAVVGTVSAGGFPAPGNPELSRYAAPAGGAEGASGWAAAPGDADGETPERPGGDLQARSRKKRNTATPKPAAETTPKPGKGTGGEKGTQGAGGNGPTATPVPEGPIIDPRSIADYLFSHDMKLPENFITKREARALGWDSSRNYVSDVAPGKSIGGDYFGNYQGKLPIVKGVSYYEADCNYTRGKRRAERIIFSTDGRVWVTRDHYETFEELFPTGQSSGGK